MTSQANGVTQSGTGQSSSDDYGYDEPRSNDSAESADVHLKLQAMNYLSDQNTSLSSLHAYDAVKAMFIRYITSLPSSTPVERLFNAAGMIETPRRNRLSDKMFERLLLLKQNQA